MSDTASKSEAPRLRCLAYQRKRKGLIRSVLDDPKAAITGGCFLAITVPIVLLIVAAVTVQLLYPQANPDNDPKVAGQKAAEKLLAKVLLAPSTAKYPADTVYAMRLPETRVDGRKCSRWLVSGAVDAQNAFGVYLRKNWEVVLADHDRYLSPIAARLDGEIIYGEARYFAE